MLKEHRLAREISNTVPDGVAENKTGQDRVLACGMNRDSVVLVFFFG
jgi:hypothetical protein